MRDNNKMWTPVRDGTAQGPAFYAPTTSGGVTFQALWSDEEGLVVAVDMRGDAVFNLDDLRRICDIHMQIMTLEPPVAHEEAKV
jgi:hypothetical protein